MNATSFAGDVATRLQAADIHGAVLVKSTPESSNFGDTGVIFRVGPLLLRFVRERGQEFVDVSTISMPQKFHQLVDVEVAMGWRSIDQVLARREPEPLDQILIRLKGHLQELGDALSNEHQDTTRASIESSAKERSRIFIEKIRPKR
jgi:hypothetical protein